MEQQIDKKLVDKLQKLLALARDGGATEGEANTAMAMAQKIARDNNVSIATIELQGGNAGDDAARLKEEAKGEGKRSWAMYKWQQDLMAEIGNVNFCYVAVKWGYNGSRKYRPIGYTIIGRASNVVAAKQMFTYLITTINRLVMAYNGGDAKLNMAKRSNSYKEGCADRLRERLSERHNNALAEQKREASERNAAARHPAAATGMALVVVLEDYAQREEELNHDYRTGVPPGTTSQRRLKEEAQQRAREAARQKRLAEATEAGATDRELAAMRMYDCSLEEARIMVDKIDDPPEDKRTEAQKAKDAEKERKQQERWDQQYHRQRQRERNRLDPEGYRAGSRAADSIGLDPQIERSEHKKLS